MNKKESTPQTEKPTFYRQLKIQLPSTFGSINDAILLKNGLCVILQQKKMCHLIDLEKRKVLKSVTVFQPNDHSVDKYSWNTDFFDLCPFLEGFYIMVPLSQQVTIKSHKFQQKLIIFDSNLNKQQSYCNTSMLAKCLQFQAMKRQFRMYNYVLSPVPYKTLFILNTSVLQNFSFKKEFKSVNDDDVKKQINYLNIKTQKIISWKLPFPTNTPKFYLVSERQVLVFAQDKCQWGVWMLINDKNNQQTTIKKLNFTKVKKTQKLIPHKICTNRSLILLLNTNFHYIYNYKNDQIIHKLKNHSDKHLECKIPMYRQINSYFDKIVEVDGNNLIYHQKINRRMLMFHIFRRSGMFQKYGGDLLIRKIFSLTKF